MPSRKASPGGSLPDPSRSYSVYVQTELDRLTTSPKCGVCGNPMHPIIVELGHAAHPCCDPHDPPSPTEIAALEAFRAGTWRAAA